MNLTYGICVSKDTDAETLFKQLISIYNASQNRLLPYYEVILCGILSDHCLDIVCDWNCVMPVSVIPYEGPADKPGHITAKKNLITKHANFHTLCIMHDYYWIPPNFIESFPGKFDVYCPPIHTLEGKRHSDWMVNPNAMKRFILSNKDVIDDLMAVNPHENGPWYINALPYSVTYLSPIMYVSGGFIVAQKSVLEDVPLNETLYWGDAEDVEWSERLVTKYRLSTTAWDADVKPVITLKPNKWAVSEIPRPIISRLKEFYNDRL